VRLSCSRLQSGLAWYSALASRQLNSDLSSGEAERRLKTRPGTQTDGCYLHSLSKRYHIANSPIAEGIHSQHSVDAVTSARADGRAAHE